MKLYGYKRARTSTWAPDSSQPESFQCKSTTVYIRISETKLLYNYLENHQEQTKSLENQQRDTLLHHQKTELFDFDLQEIQQVNLDFIGTQHLGLKTLPKRDSYFTSTGTPPSGQTGGPLCHRRTTTTI